MMGRIVSRKVVLRRRYEPGHWACVPGVVYPDAEGAVVRKVCGGELRGWLTTQECCEVLGVCMATVRRCLHEHGVEYRMQQDGCTRRFLWRESAVREVAAGMCPHVGDVVPEGWCDSLAVQEALGVSRSTVQRLVAKGVLAKRYAKVNGRRSLVFRVEDVERVKARRIYDLRCTIDDLESSAGCARREGGEV